MKYISLILFSVFLSGCATIPADYVGDWRDGQAQLTIKELGDLKYTNRQLSKWGFQKTTKSEWGIHKITNKEISGLLPFNSIAIEGPPKRDENGSMFLMVEGNKLYRSDYTPPEPEEDGLLNRILHDKYCKEISWKSSDCE